MNTSTKDATLDALCGQLKELREQAEAEGLFIGDRELLNCAHCGLQEDVLIDGRLVTYQAGGLNTADTGLRFTAIRGDFFTCPQCRSVIMSN